MVKLERHNLQSFCRTCLESLPGTSTKGYNIFETPDLTNLLIILTSYDINEDTDAIYPQQLCTKCYDMLETFKRFREMAIKSNEVLVGVLENSDSVLMIGSVLSDIMSDSDPLEGLQIKCEEDLFEASQTQIMDNVYSMHDEETVEQFENVLISNKEARTTNHLMSGNDSSITTSGVSLDISQTFSYETGLNTQCFSPTNEIQYYTENEYLNSPLRHHQLHSKQAMSAILSEMHSLKEKILQSDKKHRKMFGTLTKQVSALREKFRQVEKETLRCQEDEDNLHNLLPIRSMDSLDKFELKLLYNPKTRLDLKHILLKIDAKDVPKFIRSAIKRIMTDDVAVQFSWMGTKKKKSIQKKLFIIVIRDVCHQKFLNSEDVQMNLVLRQHFLHAKDRIDKKVQAINKRHK